MPAHSHPYPLVDRLIETFAEWLKHRREVVEMCQFDSAEFGRIAHDLGVTASDLDELVRQGPHKVEELPELLKVLGIDEAAITRAQPLVMRDLERVCALCRHKAECDHDIADGSLAEHYQAYCANKVTLDALEKDFHVSPDTVRH
ncbi:hypothetical protein BJ123_104218 [Rhodopseudomonas thermotolerans]|uniref:Uncharacterized protein n=2 Tax=Rhodopseudomonas TaxID=1073 RepID=A0A336JJN0_9BRAD|nr:MULTISPECIES: hypothetical protein [Rhodopseudomonas]RED38464.1 hypothetical protein BJ125_104218 [Rhodopseudomonas pentothenatexigens]REG06049.1 hypothetical protein BJ123_104218 [Rhodopseudomonas thermotolerans]SSW89917.1 hypothetical protein SAMN05892882_104218 [Rhodopseudomonas pentothenatexigens]